MCPAPLFCRRWFRLILLLGWFNEWKLIGRSGASWVGSRKETPHALCVIEADFSQIRSIRFVRGRGQVASCGINLICAFDAISLSNDPQVKVGLSVHAYGFRMLFRMELPIREKGV